MEKRNLEHFTVVLNLIFIVIILLCLLLLCKSKI